MKHSYGGMAAQCEGKHRYPTFTAAQETAERRKHGGRKKPVAAFRCSYCGGFHLGSNAGRVGGNAIPPGVLARWNRPKYRYVED